MTRKPMPQRVKQRADERHHSGAQGNRVLQSLRESLQSGGYRFSWADAPRRNLSESCASSVISAPRAATPPGSDRHLLSLSLEDTFPLAAIEAYLRCKLLLPRNTGLVDVMKDAAPCTLREPHPGEQGLDQLRKSCSFGGRSTGHQPDARLRAFLERMNGALSAASRHQRALCGRDRASVLHRSRL